MYGVSEDPRAWGYLPLATPESVYEIDESSPLPPFHLHLIGNAGDPRIPRELSKVTVVHNDLAYAEYYRVIQSMDLIIPAFATVDCESLTLFDPCANDPTPTIIVIIL